MTELDPNFAFLRTSCTSGMILEILQSLQNAYMLSLVKGDDCAPSLAINSNEITSRQLGLILHKLVTFQVTHKIESCLSILK